MFLKPDVWRLAAFSLCLLATPCNAAKKSEAAVFTADLTTPTIKHGVECPLPKQRPCMIKKPVGKGYRVLTPGVSMEDMGEYWLADLNKLKDPKSNKASLLIWGTHNDLHEIEILFPKEAPVKEAAKPKDAAPAKAEEKKPPE